MKGLQTEMLKDMLLFRLVVIKFKTMKLYQCVVSVLFTLSVVQCNSQKVITDNTLEEGFLKWILESRSEEIVSQRTAHLSYGNWKDVLLLVRNSDKDSTQFQKLINESNLFMFNYSGRFAGKLFLGDSALNVIASKPLYLFLKISKPIFFDQGDKVWILIEEYCGDNCGSGKIQVFKKEKNSYSLLAEKVVWIS